MTQERRLVARAARMPDIGEDKAIISMDLVKISPKKNILPEYLYGIFRFSEFSDTTKQYANGANVLHLKPDHIGGFVFPVAPIQIQSRFAEIAGHGYRKCDVLNKKNKNLRQTRDLLLPKLISGEIDIATLNIPLPETTP
jgi:type I restriction enzyme S subunit